MSDFQKIGEDLMRIRIWTLPSREGEEFSARDLWLMKADIRGEPGWTETTMQAWKARKAEIDKVPS